MFFFSVKTKINKQIINFFGSKLRRSLNQDINHSSVDLYQTVDILSLYFVQTFYSRTLKRKADVLGFSQIGELFLSTGMEFFCTHASTISTIRFYVLTATVDTLLTRLDILFAPILRTQFTLSLVSTYTLYTVLKDLFFELR